MLEIFSVAQLTGYIKNLMERDFYLQNVTVKGEISNFIAHRSGHWYFSLKDEMAVMVFSLLRAKG